MKPTLLFATLSMAFASPAAMAKSELEILRSRCAEQELQIRQLEEQVARLRSDERAPATTPTKAEPVKAAQPAAPKAASPTYTVKAGDSMEKIARKVGTNPQKLAKLNGLKTSSIIRPGQKLKVPGASIAAASPSSAPVAAASDDVPKASGKTHTVKAGETYFSISKKYGTSPEALVAANPKVKASSLRPGQVVSLGGDLPPTSMISARKAPEAKAPAPVAKSPAPESAPASSPAPAAPAPESKPAAQAATETVSATASSDKKIRPVTIEGEITYGEFASKYGTDAERLNALNGLDLTKATVLAKGSELYVPAQP